VVFNEIDWLRLTSEDCAKDGQYTFMFVGTARCGGAGSPVNPTAIKHSFVVEMHYGGKLLTGLKCRMRQLVSAPYLGKLLADLGGEVIKVEEPSGDQHGNADRFPAILRNAEKAVFFSVSIQSGSDAEHAQCRAESAAES
jgi:hypothetical protein